MNRFVLLLFVLFSMASCLHVPEPYSKIAPGQWRATLQLTPKFISENKKGEPLPEKMNLEFEEVSDGELPFFMDVIYPTEDSFYLKVRNGKEVIVLDDIKFGLDRSTAKDTLLVEFPLYNSYIKAIVEGNIMQGRWYDLNRGEYSIPFEARYGKGHHFSTLRKTPIADVSGRWEVEFAPNTEDAYPAIGEFKQEGNKVTGTFRTETGDYRFLAGEMQADKLYLSAFDGTHAFLFEAKLTDKNTMIGSFRSGKHFQTTWKAKRNSEATLTDPTSLTKLTDASQQPLSLVAADGTNIKLEEGKPKLIQIMGSWCPNCYDESKFLTEYIKANPDKNIQVIGLAFEKIKEIDDAKAQLARYKSKMNIPYPIILAGKASKKEAQKMFPQLDAIRSFPTLLFVDGKNRIRHVHTGFNGPATSEYANFKNEFEETITHLLNED